MDSSYEERTDNSNKPEDDAFERLKQSSNRDEAAIKISNNSLRRLKNDIFFIDDIRVSDKDKILSEATSLHNIFNFIQKDIELLKKEIEYYKKDVSETKNVFNFLLQKEKRIDKFINLFRKDLFWSKYITNMFVVYCETLIRKKDFSMEEPFRHIVDKKTLYKLTTNSPRRAGGILITMGLSRFKKYHFLKELFTGSVFIVLMKEKDFFISKQKDIEKTIDMETGFFKIESPVVESLNKFRKEIIDLLRGIKSQPKDDGYDKTSSEHLKDKKETVMKSFNINKNVFGKESCAIDLTSPSIMSSESFSMLSKMADVDESTKTVRQTLFFMDEISRNKSLYRGDAILKAIESPYVVEKLKAGLLQGELEHPDPKLGMERFMKIDPDNVSHMIREMNVKDGKSIEGLITFIPPKGDSMVWPWIQAGANMAFSIRIYTPNFKVVKTSDGGQYTDKFGEMQFVTFDCVRMPGFYYARMANPDQYDNRAISQEDINRFNADVKRSAESDKLHYEAAISNKEVENLIRSQESFSWFRDRFGLDLGSAKVVYAGNGTINIMTSPTRKISIQSDAYKINSILSRKNLF